MINNPKVVKHLERLKSWMADGRFAYEGREYQGPNAAFVAGDAAIMTESVKNSRCIRLGYFVHIRNILDEEMELIWNGSKTPQQAMDDAVKRGNDKLRELEKTNK